MPSWLICVRVLGEVLSVYSCIALKTAASCDLDISIWLWDRAVIKLSVLSVEDASEHISVLLVLPL